MTHSDPQDYMSQAREDGGQTARDEAAQGQERVRRDASDCIHHDNKHVDIRQ